MIFVQVDDNEGHYLKTVMDELFGRPNFVTTFIWQKVDSPNDNKVAVTPDHEYILCFAKDLATAVLKQKHDVSLLDAFRGRRVSQGGHGMYASAFDRITIEPGKMNGQPCIRGLRLTVRRIVEAVGEYRSREDLRTDYPDLDDEDIRQALGYAAAMLGDQIVELKTAS